VISPRRAASSRAEQGILIAGIDDGADDRREAFAGLDQPAQQVAAPEDDLGGREVAIRDRLVGGRHPGGAFGDRLSALVDTDAVEDDHVALGPIFAGGDRRGRGVAQRDAVPERQDNTDSLLLACTCESTGPTGGKVIDAARRECASGVRRLQMPLRARYRRSRHRIRVQALTETNRQHMRRDRLGNLPTDVHATVRDQACRHVGRPRSA
jgi:hypothetical protein